ncbi:MAG: Ada metal-binding domain-containing protein, partial [Sediminibacterium sp.]|nr:Ada metal-binding domain-containing protein [Sediminibacterium sp.]
TLQCKSGKRMNRKNRVFFASESEAIKNDFRPCGHCMKIEYKKWIYSTTK